MTLTDLQGEFLQWGSDPARPDWFRRVPAKDGANGVKFLCPVCFQANGGPVGTHSVICWEPSVPLDVGPGPGRWTMQGTGIGDLSLVAGSSSVQLNGGCNAHFFVRNGEIVLA